MGVIIIYLFAVISFQKIHGQFVENGGFPAFAYDNTLLLTFASLANYGLRYSTGFIKYIELSIIFNFRRW